MKFDNASHLSDEDLLAAVKRLAHGEREATATLIEHLSELDARRLYLGEGFSSLFNYCCQELHLSEPAAYNRIEVARAARAFPAILAMLAEGLLSLATVRLLAPHLTAENHQELLAAARGKTKRAVEEMLVRYFPKAEIPFSVRRLPTPKGLAECSELAIAAAVASPSLASAPLAPARRPVVRPLAPERYEIRFTANAETREKLREAQDLLRHAIPDGDPGKIIERALTLLVEDARRQKYAMTERPRAGRGTAPGRFGARPGSAMMVGALSWARPDGGATRRRSSSSITSSRTEWGARRRWRTFGCSVERTTASRASGSMGTDFLREGQLFPGRVRCRRCRRSCFEGSPA
jgi:hypothetical protein